MDGVRGEEGDPVGRALTEPEPPTEMPELNEPDVVEEAKDDEEEANAIQDAPKQSFQTPKPEGQFNLSNKTIRDIFQWRGKKQSLLVLLAATTFWILLEVCDFSAVTLIAWTAMAVVTAVFAGNVVAPPCGKEIIRVPDLEIPEQLVVDAARRFCRMIEDGVTWVLMAVAEGRYLVVFGEIMAALWVLSVVGSWFDLITFAYLCTVVGLILHVTSPKYEGKIKKSLETARRGGERIYKMVGEKLLPRMMVKKKPTKAKKAE